MAWETPKTDWFCEIDNDGNYIGDRFNATDFNRIKNNLEYLRDLAVRMYDTFDINSIGENKTPGDYFYADEINQIEENLVIINGNSVKRNYGVAPSYADNGKIFDYVELNRLETAILDIHDKLLNEFEGRRTFTWNFGIKGGL